MKVCVIGTGIYGTALALEMSKKDNQIVMWTENQDLYKEYKKKNRISLIKDIDLPKNITVTDSYEIALADADLILMACASRFVDKVCEDISHFYVANTPICIATKGIEESTQRLLTDVISTKLRTKNIAVISGPTFAVDMINGEPVALALGCTNQKTRKLIMNVLANDRLKLRPTKDMIGIQICGSLKNCIAIASGILNGLGYSESTQAFLINESLHDIKKVIYYLGGKPKTILTFAGVGDLTLTCTSKKSRNFSFGYTIGKTKDQKKINQYLMENTVEGYYTLEVVYRLLNNKRIDIPLIKKIYDIVYNGEDPEELARFLIEKA